MTEHDPSRRPWSRVFITGTDTAVGKTEITAALIDAARRANLRALPFKPAQSGEDRPTDAQRLAAAAAIEGLSADDLAPLHFSPPLAPGMAEDMGPFLDPDQPTSQAPLDVARQRLEALERQHRPDLVLIEGAGGLFVPMPGGTWQPQWIETLADVVLVVTRPNLGTINHTWLTLHALRTLSLPTLGLVLNEGAALGDTDDPSIPLNRQLFAHHRDTPLLGVFPRGDDPAATAHADALFAAISTRLAAR